MEMGPKENNKLKTQSESFMSDTSLTCETTTLKNRLCIYDLVLNWFLPKKKL